MKNVQISEDRFKTLAYLAEQDNLNITDFLEKLIQHHLLQQLRDKDHLRSISGTNISVM